MNERRTEMTPVLAGEAIDDKVVAVVAEQGTLHESELEREAELVAMFSDTEIIEAIRRCVRSRRLVVRGLDRNISLAD